MNDEPPPPSRGSLAAIFAVVFIDLIGFGIVLPLLARYGKYFDADDWLGPLVACFSAMQFIFAPLWGRLSDRIGRRPVLLVGLAGSAVCYAMFGVATGMPRGSTLLGLTPLAWLFVSRIGAGVAGATISTAQAYIADVTGTANRAKGMALIGAAFGIGFTFGPLLAAGFVSDDPNAPPSAAPGYLAAGMSAAAFILAAAVLREPARHAGSAVRPPGRWALARDPVRLAILAEMFLATTAFALFESTLALFSLRIGYSDRGNFLLFAFIGLTLAVSQGFLVRRLAPRLRERRMAVLGLSLMAAGLAGLTVVESVGGGANGLFLTTLAVCVIGFSFLNPALQSLLSLTTHGGQQGSVLGLGQSASALARIAGPLLGLWLFQGRWAGVAEQLGGEAAGRWATEYAVPVTYGTAAGLMALGLAALIPVMRVVGGGTAPVPSAEATAEPPVAVP